jgi:RNA polymerase-binding transcription factor DksA
MSTPDPSTPSAPSSTSTSASPATDRAALATALADDRARTAARLEALTRDVDRIVEDTALTPPDDEHDPDGATIGFERAQLIHLRDDAQAHLTDLDAAETRLAAGTAPMCEGCGAPIPLQRLLARPTARRCVSCAPTARR